MSKQRVVIDAGSILPFPGKYLSGIGRTTLELIRALESSEELPFELVLFGQRLTRDRFQRYGFSSSVRYLPLPRWRCFNWLRSSLPMVELYTGADIFHVPANYAPVFSPQKTVVTIHDAMFLCYHEDHLHSARESADILRLAASCKAIITCSHSSKNDLVVHGGIAPEKIHVIHWGVDSSLFFVEVEPGAVRNFLLERFQLSRPYFLGVSCDIGRKSTTDLVDQFLRLALEEDNHDLILVWPNPPEEIRARVLAHPQGKRVHFVKNVTDQELRFLYNGAVALLFPSKYEGFGLPVLEAMACGTPVVTCDVSSLPEVGGDAAIYIAPGDTRALFSEMAAFARGDYNRDELSKKSLRQAEKFSWRECVRKTIQVYENCLGIPGANSRASR